MSSVQERRGEPRVGFDTELWIGQEGVFTRTKARMADVSTGGARIVTSEAYQVGSVLSLRFTVGPNLINCAALVRYNHPGDGIGVQFLDLSAGDRETLDTFIHAREPEHR